METSDLCERLQWDSTFFGFPVGRVVSRSLSPAEAGRVVTWATREGVRCVYCLVDGGDVETHHAVEQAGFRFADSRVQLEWLHDPAIVTAAGSAADLVGPCRDADHPALARIARNAHDQSRFYRDRHFPRERCDALYEQWILGDCAGAAAVVLVARSPAPVGYVSCHVRGAACGSIGLLGVASTARRRGVGQALVGSALAWFATRGIGSVEIITQGHNVEALRLYQRNGFRTRAVKFWWHLWPTLAGARAGA